MSYIFTGNRRDLDSSRSEERRGCLVNSWLFSPSASTPTGNTACDNQNIAQKFSKLVNDIDQTGQYQCIEKTAGST